MLKFRYILSLLVLVSLESYGVRLEKDFLHDYGEQTKSVGIVISHYTVETIPFKSKDQKTIIEKRYHFHNESGSCVMLRETHAQQPYRYALTSAHVMKKQCYQRANEYGKMPVVFFTGNGGTLYEIDALWIPTEYYKYAGKNTGKKLIFDIALLRLKLKSNSTTITIEGIDLPKKSSSLSKGVFTSIGYGDSNILSTLNRKLSTYFPLSLQRYNLAMRYTNHGKLIRGAVGYKIEKIKGFYSFKKEETNLLNEWTLTPGMSGGAVLNKQGELVGLITATQKIKSHVFFTMNGTFSSKWLQYACVIYHLMFHDILVYEACNPAVKRMFRTHFFRLQDVPEYIKKQYFMGSTSVAILPHTQWILEKISQNPSQHYDDKNFYTKKNKYTPENTKRAKASLFLGAVVRAGCLYAAYSLICWLF